MLLPNGLTRRIVPTWDTGIIIPAESGQSSSGWRTVRYCPGGGFSIDHRVAILAPATNVYDTMSGKAPVRNSAGSASGREDPLSLHPELYQTLRAIARRERRRNPSNTLNTTVVVNEAWLKLNASNSSWKDDEHFLATAALAMRHLLVDYARRRGTEKRTKVDDCPLFENASDIDKSRETVLVIDQALSQLEHVDPRLVRLVELRFFLGLTMAEVAETLAISQRTAHREWNKARAFIEVVMQNG